MKNVCLTYVDDGKLRVAVRTIEDTSIDELLFKLDQLTVA